MKVVIFILIFLSIISHKEWFNLFSILSSGDWHYRGYNTLTTVVTNSFNMWSQDTSFGSVSVDIGMRIPSVLQGLLVQYFDLSSSLSQKLIWFIPSLFLSIYSSYKLFGYIFKNNPFAVLGASLLYNFNVYFIILQISGHMGIAMGYAFMPLFIYSYIKYAEKSTIKNFVYSIIILFLFSLYEPRIAYIGLGLSLIIAILFKVKIRYVFSYFLGFILLSAFSFFPILLGDIYFNNSITSQSIFGNQFMSLTNSIAFFHSFWSGGELEYFSINKIPIYFFIIPIFVVLGLILNIKKNRYVLLFSIFAILGIFLTKQGDYPIKGFYQWAYDNIPVFNLFRESSKFYIILAIGYSTLIGFYIKYLFSNKKIFLGYFSLFLMLTYSILNLYPILSGQEKTMFIKREIPNDYILFNKYLENDKSYSRIAVIPSGSRWIDYSKNHPLLSVSGIINLQWSNLFPEDISNNLYPEIPLSNPKNKSVIDLIKESLIGYIVVPINSDTEELFYYYGNNRKRIIESIQNKPYLEKIDIGAKNLIVFKVNPNLLGNIINSNSNSNTYFKRDNRSKINISVNIKDKYKLFFLESYHPEWKLFLKKYDNLSCDSSFKLKTNNLNKSGYIYECITSNSIFNFNDIFKLGEKNISKDSHLKAYNYANGWDISKQEIIDFTMNNYGDNLEKEGYPKKLENGKLDYKYYILNPNGSIDIELELYFKPQSYFYLGLVISFFTFILLMILLILSNIKNTKTQKMSILKLVKSEIYYIFTIKASIKYKALYLIDYIIKLFIYIFSSNYSDKYSSIFLKGDFTIKNSHGTFHIDSASDMNYLIKPYYENEIRKYFNTQNGIFIDIGSNIGKYPVYMGNKYKDLKIICFEPNPYIFGYLKNNIKINNLNKNVVLHNLGLGNKDTTINLKVPKGNYGQASSVNEFKGEVDNIDIKVKKLDSFINSIDIKNINLIKIDVEGFELNVLKGGEKLFDKIQDCTLIIEIFQDFDEINNLLISKGFKSIGNAIGNNYVYKKG